MTKQPPSLFVCILMDILGYATYAIPFLGEFGDVLWAPISSIIFFMMFGGWKGALGGAFNFVEEILPFTDFIPTFTLTWFFKYGRSGNKIHLNPFSGQNKAISNTLNR